MKFMISTTFELTKLSGTCAMTLLKCEKISPKIRRNVTMLQLRNLVTEIK